MRDRLIELINNGSDKYPTLPTINGCKEEYNHFLADHLLANGVVVPPCKVGQTVYFLGGISGKSIKKATVEEIIINDCGVRDLLVTTENCVTFENSIETFFLTKEEAEAALKGEKV